MILYTKDEGEALERLRNRDLGQATWREMADAWQALHNAQFRLTICVGVNWLLWMAAAWITPIF